MTSVNAVAVTPSDVALLPGISTGGLYIGGTGNVTVTISGPNGQKITFDAVPVGILPVSVSQVWSTGTTATDIIALYDPKAV